LRWIETREAIGIGVGSAIAVSGDRLLAGWRFNSRTDPGDGMVGTMGGVDVALASLSTSSGGHLWSHAFGGVNDDYLDHALAADDGGFTLSVPMRGAVDLGGGFTVADAGSTQAVLLRYTLDGALSWVKTFGAGDTTSVTNVAMVPGSNRIAAYGEFSGAVDFGVRTLVANGTRDLFLLFVDPVTGVPKGVTGYDEGYDGARAMVSLGSAGSVLGYELGGRTIGLIRVP
ncbi:MAG: hypothetical protein JRH20_16750, partial [Deltaproteobacteria bacterium]|nr:hypothetical protein [Deltaproteobacteria bacterium]